MVVETFINNYRKAFGEIVSLPLVFWYSDAPVNLPEKTNGCFFKKIPDVIKGQTVSFDENAIGCGGGKYYTGFTELPERILNFVSLKEKYKETPEKVKEFLDELNLQPAPKKYLNFARIDKIDNFLDIEGIVFFATPDILSGLVAWAFFDTNAQEAVSVLFGSGCSAVVSQAVMENKMGGKRTFLGLFDPSVRPYLDEHVLSFVIPMSRFKEMYFTINKSCLEGTHAWNKIKERINRNIAQLEENDS